MNAFITEVNALAALQSIVAQQNMRGEQSEAGKVHTFLNDRIDFYRSRGMDQANSLRLAREDRVAQF